MTDLEILKNLKKAKSRIYRIKQKGLYSDSEKLFNEQLFMENIDIRHPAKLTHNQIQKVGKITNAFLNSKSSTVTGIKSIIAKRGYNLREMARERGVTLNDSDMSRLCKVLSSSTYKKLMELAIPSDKIIPLLIEVVSFKTMGKKGRMKGKTLKDIDDTLKTILKNAESQGENFYTEDIIESLNKLRGR
jgi:hypothetical protein